MVLLSWGSKAQIDTICLATRTNFATEMGYVEYFFWEEDTSGTLTTDPFSHLYFSNYEVVRNTRFESHFGNVGLPIIADQVKSFCAQQPRKNKQHKSHNATLVPLIRSNATRPCTIIYYRTPQNWITQKCGMVLYFNVLANGNIQFSHSSDTLQLACYSYKEFANNRYCVYTYWGINGKPTTQKIKTATGDDITASFEKKCSDQPLRFLIFANGYRGNAQEHFPSENKLFTKDVFYYWFKLDNRFAARLQPYLALYIDGSFSVRTSNHRSRLNFGRSLLRVMLTPKNKVATNQSRKLNMRPNSSGFYEREKAGQQAGNVFLLETKTLPNSTQIKDTIDIVCHSMGYAYTLGFLKAVTAQVVLGKIYIIAPENAAIDGFDWTQFQEVWQYGSNLNLPEQDPLRDQDGIAPQVAVKNIDQVLPTKGGRVYFPVDWPNKHFVHTHMIYSYDWIFDRIGPGMPGYVNRTF